MPYLHPYHQILLRKAIVNEYIGRYDSQIKGNEIKNLAANDLNVSYNTLRKLFLSNDENSNFQEYTLNKIVWYVSKAKSDFKFSENKTQKYWYNFRKYFQIPLNFKTIEEVHFNVLNQEEQAKIELFAKKTLIEKNIKTIDFSIFIEEKEIENQVETIKPNIEKMPLEGIYAVYRTDNKNRYIEKRYARIFQQNGKLEFELITAMFNYKSVIFEYNYPSIYMVFDNGLSKITFNLHCGNMRVSEILMGTFSHFSISAGKADAGVVIFVKQQKADSDFVHLQGKSYLINSKLTDKEEITIQKYFKALKTPSFISEPAINLNELEQITNELNLNNNYKQNEIIHNYYTGSYFLYGKNKNDDNKLIKSPCRIWIDETNEAVFEINGRTYSFKSKSISLINNFLYIEIDNKLFNDKGFYTFSLSPTQQPKYITGIASFINAENKPMSRRVVLYKYSNSINDYENLVSSSINFDAEPNEISKFDKKIIEHFSKQENNIIIDDRLEY